MEIKPYTGNSNIDDTISSTNQPYILLLERAESTIGVVDEDLFEGTAAVLDVMNDNQRIYTKDEYLSHLPYLQEKIKRGRLFGEVDHPQGYYDVMLKNISHRIEALWYDEPSNTIKIRIRLLRGTPGGDFARKLVELGIPLAISSRAVGKVVDNKPQILRIFTFDLVAEPGFRDSILHPSSDIDNSSILKENLEYITESLNSLEKNSILNQYEVLNENKKYGDYLQIYKINNEKVIEELDSLFENNSNATQNNSTNMDIKEFAAYSEKTKLEINGIKALLGNLNESLQEVQGQIQNAQQPVIQPTAQFQTQDDVQAQVTELPNMSEDDEPNESLDKLKMYVEFMSAEITKLGQNQIQLQESLNAQNSLIHTVGKAVNRTINHENLLTKKINETLNFLDNEILPNINESADVTNTQSYLITKLIEMGDHLSDKTNDALNYGNFLGSVSEAHAGFMNILANNVGEGRHIDGVKLVNVSESKQGTTPNAPAAPTSINENANVIPTKTNKVTKTTKVVPVADNSPKQVFEGIQATANKILERIDENSTLSILKKQNPFLNLLESANQEKFFALNHDIKKEVVDTLNKGTYFNQADVMMIMESVVNGQNSDLPNHMRFIPEEFKPAYGKLNESQVAEIDNMAKSGLYRLDTPYQVKSFWYSMGLNESLNQMSQANLKETQDSDKLQKLNESADNTPVVENNFVYGQNFVDNILKR